MPTETAAAASTSSLAPIAAGQRVNITKGCKARGIAAHQTCRVVEVAVDMGADYGHACKVVLEDPNLRRVAFYVRHRNRLADVEVSANDGNPSHLIRFVRSSR